MLTDAGVARQVPDFLLVLVRQPRRAVLVALLLDVVGLDVGGEHLMGRGGEELFKGLGFDLVNVLVPLLLDVVASMLAENTWGVGGDGGLK